VRPDPICSSTTSSTGIADGLLRRNGCDVAERIGLSTPAASQIRTLSGRRSGADQSVEARSSVRAFDASDGCRIRRGAAFARGSWPPGDPSGHACPAVTFVPPTPSRAAESDETDRGGDFRAQRLCEIGKSNVSDRPRGQPAARPEAAGTASPFPPEAPLSALRAAGAFCGPSGAVSGRGISGQRRLRTVVSTPPFAVARGHGAEHPCSA